MLESNSNNNNVNLPSGISAGQAVDASACATATTTTTNNSPPTTTTTTTSLPVVVPKALMDAIAPFLTASGFTGAAAGNDADVMMALQAIQQQMAMQTSSATPDINNATAAITIDNNASAAPAAEMVEMDTATGITPTTISTTSMDPNTNSTTTNTTTTTINSIQPSPAASVPLTADMFYPTIAEIELEESLLARAESEFDDSKREKLAISKEHSNSDMLIGKLQAEIKQRQDQLQVMLVEREAMVKTMDFLDVKLLDIKALIKAKLEAKSKLADSIPEQFKFLLKSLQRERMAFAEAGGVLTALESNSSSRMLPPPPPGSISLSSSSGLKRSRESSPVSVSSSSSRHPQSSSRSDHHHSSAATNHLTSLIRSLTPLQRSNIIAACHSFNRSPTGTCTKPPGTCNSLHACIMCGSTDHSLASCRYPDRHICVDWNMKRGFRTPPGTNSLDVPVISIIPCPNEMCARREHRCLRCNSSSHRMIDCTVLQTDPHTAALHAADNASLRDYCFAWNSSNGLCKSGASCHRLHKCLRCLELHSSVHCPMNVDAYVVDASRITERDLVAGSSTADNYYSSSSSSSAAKKPRPSDSYYSTSSSSVDPHYSSHYSSRGGAVGSSSSSSSRRNTNICKDWNNNRCTDARDNCKVRLQEN